MSINKDFAKRIYLFVKQYTDKGFGTPHTEVKKFVEFEAPGPYNTEHYVNYLKWVGSVESNAQGVWALRDPQESIKFKNNEE